MLKEFKEFALKGNVLDMAIGVIIGGAFGNIVSSLVADVFTPIIGFLTAGADLTQLKVVISEAIVENGEVIKEAVSINYGNFLQSVFNFITIALCIFLFVKVINKAKRQPKEAPTPEAPPEPSEEVLLLREIAASLKK